MNNTVTQLKICAAAALLAAASTAADAQSTPASGSHGTATPAGMPPGATSTKGDKAAAPAGNVATDPNTGSTPGMPPNTTDGAATPKGKGNGHSKHTMKHGDSAASGAGTTTTP